ncbi:MAG: sulfatase [Kiritimatiellales bacterium]
MKKKNVLFVVAHDISNRWGCLGDPHAVTPNIDALAAEESLVFEKHYCQWPLCGPSRANLISGCRPMTTERYDNSEFWGPFRQKMGKDYHTLPQHFKENGYYSQCFWQVLHGFETDPESWSGPHWLPSHPENVPGIPEDAWEEMRYWANPESLDFIRDRIAALQEQGRKIKGEFRRFRGPGTEAGNCSDAAYVDGQATDRIVAAIEAYDRKEPFFFAVGYEMTHTPWCAPKEYWELYDRDRLTIPGAADQPPGTPDWVMGDKEPAQYYWQHSYDKVWHPDYEEEKEMLHGHYATISFYDAQVGRLVEALKKAGRYDDTIIVVTTDHGFTIGEHGYWGKHNMWEPSFHIPLLIHVPGYQPSRKSTSRLTEHVDVYPTLCDLCGLDKPDYLEGSSFAPLMGNPSKPWKKAVFAHRMPQYHDLKPDYKHGRTVRTDRYRYTFYEGENGAAVHEELFDYSSDPTETRNLALDPEYDGLRAELKELLDAGWQACRIEQSDS